FCCLLALVSFVLMFFGPIRAQQDTELARCWKNMFPDLGRPWLLPWWIVDTTLQVVNYGAGPIGQITGIFCVSFGGVVWRRQQGRFVALIVPAGLALVAALLHAYPYGRTRVMAYSVPAAILLLAGGYFRAWRRLRHPMLAGLLCAVMLLPAANAAR